MPGNKPTSLLDKAVSRIQSRGVAKSSAYPMAVAALQKAGDLKVGTLKPTAKGSARNKMTPAQRHKLQP